MLGVDYQVIYCSVKGCKYNEKHVTRDGTTNKPVDVYFTCKKEKIYLNHFGRCIHKPRKRD